MTDNPEMEKYLKLLGNVNLRMGEMADLVTEVVYGIPDERKDIKNENDNRRCIPGEAAYAKSRTHTFIGRMGNYVKEIIFLRQKESFILKNISRA